MGRVKTRREFRHCEHYDGRQMIATDQTVCKAGVDALALVGGERFGWFTRCPCYEKNQSSVTCDKREFPSWEEVARREAEMDDAMNKIVLVRSVIPPKGASGTVECPKCKGDLDWSRSSYNGHIHGKCRTDKCLSWME